MHKDILLNKNLSLEKRLRRYFDYILLHYKRGKSWKKRHKKIVYGSTSIKNQEKKHQIYWKDLKRNCDVSTLRISHKLTGKNDIRIVPEEIFATDITPTLNIYNEGKFQGIKSIYTKWFGEHYFPKSLLHNIDGIFFNDDLQVVTNEEVLEILKDIQLPVVFKPNIYSNGGIGVEIVHSPKKLKKLVLKNENFVVQEVVEQHEFFKKFNPGSSNTIRVFLYRSVTTNELHILGMAMKTGRANSFVDNESAKGLVSRINEDGELDNFAFNKFAEKYEEHPDTDVKFTGKIPQYYKLVELSKRVAKKILYLRIIGLDVSLNSDGDWKVIEVNLGTQSTRFLQYAGQPFFGEFSDEVIEYVKENHWAKRLEG